MPIESSQKFLKTQLRNTIRRKRTSIGTARRKAWDAKINDALEAYARRKTPRVVAAYLAFDGEPNLAPSLSVLAELGTKLAVPVIHGEPDQRFISMRQFIPDEGLQTNYYGIAEPVAAREFPLTDIDLVLVPLVAWDRRGNRLGMGAGYYDRLFQPVSRKKRPVRVGVGYDLQQSECVPVDPWDIRLHAVLTEKGWFDSTS